MEIIAIIVLFGIVGFLYGMGKNAMMGNLGSNAKYLVMFFIALYFLFLLFTIL